MKLDAITPGLSSIVLSLSLSHAHTHACTHQEISIEVGICVPEFIYDG